MLRLGNLELQRVAGNGNCAYYAYLAGCEVLGVPVRVLLHQPADTGKMINLQHPDHREQRFLRCVAVRCLTACDFGLVLCRQLFPSGGEATWYTGSLLFARSCRRAPPGAPAVVTTGMASRRTSTTASGVATLLCPPVLDIVIINGIAKTDTVRYLCTTNGNFSSQHV
eukprot:4661376-Pleurochrysis_carterae.AAC.2